MARAQRRAEGLSGAQTAHDRPGLDSQKTLILGQPDTQSLNEQPNTLLKSRLVT